jgi:hypothetical protein
VNGRDGVSRARSTRCRETSRMPASARQSENVPVSYPRLVDGLENGQRSGLGHDPRIDREGIGALARGWHAPLESAGLRYGQRCRRPLRGRPCALCPGVYRGELVVDGARHFVLVTRPGPQGPQGTHGRDRCKAPCLSAASVARPAPPVELRDGLTGGGGCVNCNGSARCV